MFLFVIAAHPVAVDVFENHLYWLTRDNGLLLRQDKFGRGVPYVITKDLVNPSGVKGTSNFTSNI